MDLNGNRSIYVDESQGFSWQYLNNSMKCLEEKTMNLVNEPNVFTKPIKYLQKKQEKL